VRAAMGPHDRLLLGVDVRRDRGQLEAAYNDVGGVLAAYHERALAALNRELGTDFDPARFHYRAVYDEENRRVEMHLVASGAVQATVPGLGVLAFRRGDSIRAAVHCVYDRGRVTAMMDGVGLRLAGWAADEGGTFAIALAAPAVGA
ncbi:MAG TPA: L-histidine N(alpha)-methyltransferase, partial [Gemmatimonadaceae bacterium]|nr:L-histidine N(alpha)-methyltransferase [Gemmatimonadaceae bacterium]